jgi:hypothetical protein
MDEYGLIPCKSRLWYPCGAVNLSGSMIETQTRGIPLCIPRCSDDTKVLITHIIVEAKRYPDA